MITWGHKEWIILELLVGQSGVDGYPVTTTQSVAGDARTVCDLDPQEVVLQQALGALAYRALDSDGLIALGSRLFEALFADDVGDRYRSNLSIARAQGKRLGIRLRLEPPELAALPWEYLYDAQEDAFLSISPETALLRYIPVNIPARPLSVSPPLRVLVLIASPTNLPPVQMKREKDTIQEALAELIKAGRVKLEFLDNAVVGKVNRALRRFDPHVVHFVGHGRFDQGSASVVLVDQEGYANPIDERVFREFFSGSGATRLVVLGACESASVSSTQPLVGLAPRLLQRQISAVVAMQYPITDQVAIVFDREFYQSLALAYPIDAAVSEARRGIYLEMGGQTPDWGIPVLFLRAQDGVLWQFNREQTTSAQDQRMRAASDAMPAGTGTQGSGGVTIGGGSHVTVGGSLVGGNQTIIDASSGQGHDSVKTLRQTVDWERLVADLTNLVEALDDSAGRGAIGEEDAILAGAQVRIAISNAKKRRPDPDRITLCLGQAKEIIERATLDTCTAAQWVAVLVKAIEMIYR